VANFSTPHQINRLIEMYHDNQSAIQAQTSSPEPANCKTHQSEHLILYCETCESLVCRDCALLLCARKNHSYDPIEDMVKKYETSLDRDLDPIRTLHQQMSKALKDISAAESELQQQKDATFHRISSTFDAFVEILEQEHCTEHNMARATFKLYSCE